MDLEGVKRSLDRVKEKLSSRRLGSIEGIAGGQTSPDIEPTIPEVSYLLVSPILPPISSFASMFSTLSFRDKMMSVSPHVHDDSASTEQSSELVIRPSCAVYGDRDFFTSPKKLRRWGEQLQRKPDSRFRFFEIDGAGHFWHEDGARERLKWAVREWLNKADAM